MKCIFRCTKRKQFCFLFLNKWKTKSKNIFSSWNNEIKKTLLFNFYFIYKTLVFIYYLYLQIKNCIFFREIFIFTCALLKCCFSSWNFFFCSLLNAFLKQRQSKTHQQICNYHSEYFKWRKKVKERKKKKKLWKVFFFC